MSGPDASRMAVPNPITNAISCDVRALILEVSRQERGNHAERAIKRRVQDDEPCERREAVQGLVSRFGLRAAVMNPGSTFTVESRSRRCFRKSRRGQRVHEIKDCATVDIICKRVVNGRHSKLMGGTIMKLHRVKECLNVHDSDISGSVYDDVNMSGSTVGNVNLAGCSFKNVNMSGATFEDANLSGWKLNDVNLAGLKIVKANLAGASITQGRMEGMTIEGILVSDLLAAYRTSTSAENKKE